MSLNVHAQTTSQDWQAKAIQKYPDIGVAGSELNKRFVEAYTERRKANPSFFNNPEWPLTLADELAKAQTNGARPQGSNHRPPVEKPEIEKQKVENAQRDVIRRARTAFIAVEQTFKTESGEAIPNVSLPFAETAAVVLGHAGIEKAPSPDAADINVTIYVEAREISGSYSLGGFGAGTKIVAGSSLTGEIAIKSGGMSPVRKPLGSRVELPSSVERVGPRFGELFDRCNLVESLVVILSEARGVGFWAKGMGDPSAQVRGHYATALGTIPTPETISPLTNLLEDSDEGVRFAAADGLAKSSDGGVTLLLIAAFEKGDPKTKAKLAHYLGKRRDPKAVDALVAQLKAKDAAAAFECVQALGAIRDRRAIDPLIEVMEKPNIRLHARQALKAITGEDLGDEPLNWRKWREK